MNPDEPTPLPALPTLTDLRTVDYNGSACQVARLPYPGDSVYFSDWVAYNGNAQEYELRWRFSKSMAEHLGLPR